MHAVCAMASEWCMRIARAPRVRGAMYESAYLAGGARTARPHPGVLCDGGCLRSWRAMQLCDDGCLRRWRAASRIVMSQTECTKADDCLLYTSPSPRD